MPACDRAYHLLGNYNFKTTKLQNFKTTNLYKIFLNQTL